MLLKSPNFRELILICTLTLMKGYLQIKITLLICCCALPYMLNSQELPPIETYLPKDYGAEDQIWSISQGEDNTIFFANNEGLLEYNGAKWTLYETPNSSIVLNHGC